MIRAECHRHPSALCLLVIWTVLVPASLAAESAPPSAEAIGAIEAMRWITEQYPPFNYRDPEDGQIKGITVDILMEVFEKLGVGTRRGDIALLPWARGYQAALEKPGTALFSMTHTEERQKLFAFVGPIVPTRVSLIAKKSRMLKVASVADMNALKIGVIRDDVGDQLIRGLGVSSRAIHTKAAADNIVRMLYRGRLDAIAYAEDIARHQTRIAGLDPAECEAVYILKQSHMYYAFHATTDPAALEVLQRALDDLRADGTVDRIRDRYLK